MFLIIKLYTVGARGQNIISYVHTQIAEIVISIALNVIGDFYYILLPIETLIQTCPRCTNKLRNKILVLLEIASEHVRSTIKNN